MFDTIKEAIFDAIEYDAAIIRTCLSQTRHLNPTSLAARHNGRHG